MKILERYELNFEPTLEYVKNNLTSGTTLSLELLNIDFKKGRFFTFLPTNSNFKRIYEFIDGLIIPQNPTIEYISSEKKSMYCVLPTLDEEVSSYISNRLNQNKKLFCIFDDVISSPEDFCLMFFRENNLLYNFENEVYYLITNDNNKFEFILNAMQNSNAIWHSLGVLTETNFDNVQPHKLSLENIKDISLGVQIIIVSAYDGEGYVFWEKS